MLGCYGNNWSRRHLGCFSTAIVGAIQWTRARLPSVGIYRSIADLLEEISAANNLVQIDPVEDFFFNRYPLFPLPSNIEFDFNFLWLELLESYAVDSLWVATPFRVTLAMFRHCGLGEVAATWLIKFWCGEVVEMVPSSKNLRSDRDSVLTIESWSTALLSAWQNDAVNISNNKYTAQQLMQRLESYLPSPPSLGTDCKQFIIAHMADKPNMTYTIGQPTWF